MKIRLGFVSNSSSSSFIIIHTPINNLTDEIIDDERLRICGDFLSEGYDLFKPDTLTRKYLKNPDNDRRYLEFYLVDRMISEDDPDSRIEASDIGKKVFSINVDYCSTPNGELDFENFEGRYI